MSLKTNNILYKEKYDGVFILLSSTCFIQVVRPVSREEIVFNFMGKFAKTRIE